MYRRKNKVNQIDSICSNVVDFEKFLESPTTTYAKFHLFLSKLCKLLEGGNAVVSIDPSCQRFIQKNSPLFWKDDTFINESLLRKESTLSEEHFGYFLTIVNKKWILNFVRNFVIRKNLIGEDFFLAWRIPWALTSLEALWSYLTGIFGYISGYQNLVHHKFCNFVNM